MITNPFYSYSGRPTFDIVRQGCIKYAARVGWTVNVLYVPVDFEVDLVTATIAERLQLTVKHERVGPGRWGVGYEPG